MLGVHKTSVFSTTGDSCAIVFNTWYNLVVDQHMICLICFGFSKPYCDTPIFPWRTPSRNLVWEQWVTGGGGCTSMCLYYIVLHLYPATSCDWRGWRYIIFPGLLSGGCHNLLVAQMVVYNCTFSICLFVGLFEYMAPQSRTLSARWLPLTARTQVFVRLFVCMSVFVCMFDTVRRQNHCNAIWFQEHRFLWVLVL